MNAAARTSVAFVPAPDVRMAFVQFHFCSDESPQELQTAP
jgi:hypothetical protein